MLRCLQLLAGGRGREGVLGCLQLLGGGRGREAGRRPCLRWLWREAGAEPLCLSVGMC